MRFLVMTASFGTGHNQVAAALAEAAGESGHNACVIDALAEGLPLFGSCLTNGFIQLIKTAPGLYRSLYTHSECADQFRALRSGAMRLLAGMIRPSIAPVVEQFRPDVVLCTHPFVLGAMSHLRRQGRLGVPVAGVLTDFAPHGFWLHPGVDEYFVATAEMAREMISRGIEPQRLCVTGIPVRPAFTRACDRQAAARSLGLDPGRPTILIMGGGLGLGPVREAVAAACLTSVPVQIVVVAGQNAGLQAELLPLAHTQHGNGTCIQVHGYVPFVDRLMAASDLLISKPGAVTAAEALGLGLPMLLLSPIPGHEERNQAVLTASGAARALGCVEELPVLLTRLLLEPKGLAAMRRAARQMGRPEAARSVISHLSEAIAHKEMLPA